MYRNFYSLFASGSERITVPFAALLLVSRMEGWTIPIVSESN
jgi:hypothetical protein